MPRAAETSWSEWASSDVGMTNHILHQRKIRAEIGTKTPNIWYEGLMHHCENGPPLFLLDAAPQNCRDFAFSELVDVEGGFI